MINAQDVYTNTTICWFVFSSFKLVISLIFFCVRKNCVCAKTVWFFWICNKRAFALIFNVDCQANWTVHMVVLIKLCECAKESIQQLTQNYGKFLFKNAKKKSKDTNTHTFIQNLNTPIFRRTELNSIILSHCCWLSAVV